MKRLRKSIVIIFEDARDLKLIEPRFTLLIRLAAHCVAAGSLIAASVVSPNPVTIDSAIHVITEIYENC